eukprot:15734067-Heterocapsa_arctica.AAC.1
MYPLPSDHAAAAWGASPPDAMLVPPKRPLGEDFVFERSSGILAITTMFLAERLSFCINSELDIQS